ncbi:hypothetical protein AAIO99_37385, partial [Streptomyces sp. AC154]
MTVYVMRCAGVVGAVRESGDSRRPGVSPAPRFGEAQSLLGFGFETTSTQASASSGAGEPPAPAPLNSYA